jgi:hypothetical protein
MQSTCCTRSGLSAVLVTLACIGSTHVNGQAICGNPNSTGAVQSLPQNGGGRGVDFVRTDLLPYEHASTDDAAKPDLISFNMDVLLSSAAATRGDVSVGGSDLLIRSVICIRYRPELLGLQLENRGGPLPDSLISVEMIGGGATALLFGRLQRMEAGKVMSVLLSSSVPLGDAQKLTLRVHP